jgi:hypothetical protein
MAKIETVNMDGREMSALNISRVVGFPRKGDDNSNQRDDILVIQGFFNYIAKGLQPEALGLGNGYVVPQITGIRDRDTLSAISLFQITNASQLLMEVYDGRIDPANYKNRKLRSNRKQMSIVYLHLLALDASVMLGDGWDGYIQGMAKLNLELAFVIDRAVLAQ